MPSTGALKGPSLGQYFRMMVICIVLLQVLLQAVSVAVTYMYFTNKMKQLQDNYSKIGLACFLKENEDFWDSTDEDILNRPCLQAKRQLYQLIEEVTLRTFETTISAVPEKQLSTPPLPRGRRPQTVAAHITGITRRSNSVLIPYSKDGKTLGQKIESWESSRKGHSFLSHVLLRKGELVIQQPGLYYIYSQTYFRFQEAEEASKTVSKDRGRIKQMVQYIYKYTSYPDPIMLMKSARNSCWSTEAEYGLYSIYQGGLFELKENDRVFVSVTNEHLMDLDQEASFFGAFLIN
ncbi:tumor necrosis factor ligand superfamily member 10 isoform X1 [Apodemus sylvaticus]|uniref:tumor necrosis factor ligand superfamily member 10 isoform X1 n=1 Tax=Apodemus sylvaticus TaxID=10129 RepID=UPI0022442EF5|nr:tumor necrosis factor ligand superfamily member 10 isoform X1 [Apodemus sylvaticus]